MDLSDTCIFFLIRLRLCGFGKNTTDLKSSCHYIISGGRWYAQNIYSVVQMSKFWSLRDFSIWLLYAFVMPSVLTLLMVLEDAPGLSCIFPTLTLRSPIKQTILVLFIKEKLPETKIWVLGYPCCWSILISLPTARTRKYECINLSIHRHV